LTLSLAEGAAAPARLPILPDFSDSDADEGEEAVQDNEVKRTKEVKSDDRAPPAPKKRRLTEAERASRYQKNLRPTKLF
jgi:hypothetical protein